MTAEKSGRKRRRVLVAHSDYWRRHGVSVLFVSLVMFCFFFDSKKPGAFDKHDFELLAPVLDGFSLMTYDYSSHGR